MPRRGSQFEYTLTRAINDCFAREHVRGVAYRRYAPPKVEQLYDILIDCGSLNQYAAIECKSAYASTGIVYYFSKASTSNGRHQFSRELDWAEKAGRSALLALEVKDSEKRKRRAFIIPMSFAAKRLEEGAVGLTLADCAAWHELLPASGGYYMPLGTLLWALGV